MIVIIGIPSSSNSQATFLLISKVLFLPETYPIGASTSSKVYFPDSNCLGNVTIPNKSVSSIYCPFEFLETNPSMFEISPLEFVTKVS